MPGIRQLSKIQMGDESVAGTAVAASAIWRGTGTGRDVAPIVHVEENVGILMGTNRTMRPQLGAEITFDATPATYEQLPYILEAGIETETPTQDGAGSDYIYVYNFPTTAQRTVRTYTLEYHDNEQAYEAEYCFVRDFAITGRPQDAVMMSANWFGRQEATSTFTGAISLPAVEEILFGNCKLYIDGVGTFPATTQKTDTFKGFDLNVTTGHVANFTGDGNLYFTSLKQVMPEVTLAVRLESDSISHAEIALLKSETPQSFRIQAQGSAVGTPGTTYSNKEFHIEVLGNYVEVNHEEEDGNNIVVLTIVARYDGTAASSGLLRVVNELSALP